MSDSQNNIRQASEDIRRYNKAVEACEEHERIASIERLKEYILLRCDQNEREGSTKVRLEIKDIRTVLGVK